MAYVTRRIPETSPQAGHDNGKKTKNSAREEQATVVVVVIYLKEQAKERMRLNAPT